MNFVLFGITHINSTLTNDELSIIIHPIVGSFANMLLKRTWIIEIPVAASFQKVLLNGKKVSNISFNKRTGLLRFQWTGMLRDKQTILIKGYKSTY